MYHMERKQTSKYTKWYYVVHILNSKRTPFEWNKMKLLEKFQNFILPYTFKRNVHWQLNVDIFGGWCLE